MEETKKTESKKRKDKIKIEEESAKPNHKKTQFFLTENKEDTDSELDDETWIAKKEAYWKRNHISPIKMKDGSMNPAELAAILSCTFGP